MSAKTTPKKARAKATPTTARVTAMVAEWEGIGLTSSDLLIALQIVVEGTKQGDSPNALVNVLGECFPRPSTPAEPPQKIGRKSPRKVRQ